MRRNKKEAIRKLQKAYHKSWRSRNKSRIKLYNQRFWQKKESEAATLTEQEKAVRDDNN